MTTFPTIKRYRSPVFLAVLAAISLGFFLFLSSRYGGAGFPLDDAWIHQTYARNLAQFGEWSFIPGQPSGGSTSPLWSAILALGYSLKFSPTAWVYLLGWVQLWSLGLLTLYGLAAFVPRRVNLAFGGGLLMIFEFHLVWAAGSGMETLFYALLILGFLIWLSRPEVPWFVMGLWIGLAAWVRPDGITLIGPALMALLLSGAPWRDLLKRGGQLGSGILLLFVPYLLFNRALAGAWWPNTFFAKQAEYAVLLNQPILMRLGKQFSLPLVGVGVVLLPGFAWWVFRSVRRRRWPFVACAIWLVGYLFLYAWRLPVTYQHGRYVMPAMPVYFLFGLAGFFDLADLNSQALLRRVVFRAWLLSGVLVLFSFWLRGAFAYAQDVAVIQTEMVATANWVAVNTPPQALIAAHDIGALGYFGNRELVDLAGLISPEVIPFIRDETKLAQYLNERKVDYLITFPGWYPQLASQGELIYTTGGIVSPSLGGENMNVYHWGPP